MAQIQKQWDDEGRGPLFSLKESHYHLLERQKKYWKMKSNDWFVCSHVRSGGYHRKEDEQTQNFCNTNIEDYYLLIDSVTEKGGWIIQMGDTSAERIDRKKLRHPSRVIEYAHHLEKSPSRLQVFIISIKNIVWVLMVILVVIS